MNIPQFRSAKLAAKVLASVAGVALLASCGIGTTVETTPSAQPSANADGSSFNLTAEQNRIVPDKVDSIASKVPAKFRDNGKLVVAMGVGQNQYPPLAFTATDNKTLIGLAPDISTLISGVLGLELEIVNTSFEDVFIGLDSTKYDVTIANVGVSAERLQKYDQAPYRLNKYAFEVKAGSDLKISEAKDVSGKTVAVKPGTLQATLLQKWSDDLVAAGEKPIEIKAYPASSAAFLAVQSGQIDAYLTIGSTAEYNSGLPGAQIQIAGYFPDQPNDYIAATSLKGSGIGEPICEAINHVIGNGQYAEVLARWNMSDYAIKECDLNPKIG